MKRTISAPGQRTPEASALRRDAEHPIPQVSRARVRRPRIYEALDGGASTRLTLVVAAAGSGKTTALAQWVAELPTPVSWVTASSDAPASLVRVEAALSDAAKDHERSIVVVDDAHRLPPQAWPLIDNWLDSSAAGHVNLVLTSRRDVPLPVVLWELSDDVTEIRSDVLSFTDDEARELIALHAPQVSEIDAAALQGRADGWAAALVLGARAFAASTLPHLREGLNSTERPVLDYLLGEVFSTLPAMVRHVLLCTGGLDDVTEDAAVVLSGDPDAGRRLADLAADGMLVTQYQISRNAAGADEPRAWHYHPLLLELLRRQTALDGPDHALAMAAHARAAHHYAVHGRMSEAVRHAMWARDDELLTGLLLAETPALIASGHVDLLHAALRSLSADAAEGRPALLGVTALAHLAAGDRETAARLAAWLLPTLDEIRERGRLPSGAKDSTDIIPAMLADGALLEMWQARIGWMDPHRAIRHAREVLGCAFSTADERPQQDMHPNHRPLSPLSLARVVWLLNELTTTESWVADLASARAHSIEALDSATVLGYPLMRGAAWANRALLDMVVGKPLDAAAAAERSLACADDQPYFPSRVRCHVVLGWAALIDFRFTDAVHHVEWLEKLGIPAGAPTAQILAGTLRAGLAVEAGDPAAGRAIMAAVAPGADRAATPFRNYVLRTRAEWAIRAHDVAGLRHEIEFMRTLGWADGVDLYSPMLVAFTGNVSKGISELSSFMARHPDGVLGAIAAACRLGLLLQSDDAASQRAYREALDRISSQRLFRTMAYAGLSDPKLSALVKADAGSSDPHPFTPEFARALSRYRGFRRMALNGAFTSVLGAVRPSEFVSIPAQELPMTDIDLPVPAETRTRPPQSVPALTARERDVLRELALGGAYADIARNLFVTENTVKTHIISVYRKLGVDRRADALRRAREIGLLS